MNYNLVKQEVLSWNEEANLGSMIGSDKGIVKITAVNYFGSLLGTMVN